MTSSISLESNDNLPRFGLDCNVEDDSLGRWDFADIGFPAILSLWSWLEHDVKQNPGTKTLLMEVAAIQREHQSHQRLLIGLLAFGGLAVVGLVAVLALTLLTTKDEVIEPPASGVGLPAAAPVGIAPAMVEQPTKAQDYREKQPDPGRDAQLHEKALRPPAVRETQQQALASSEPVSSSVIPSATKSEARAQQVIFFLPPGTRLRLNGEPLADKARPKPRQVSIELEPGQHRIETRRRGGHAWMVQQLEIGSGPAKLMLRFNQRTQQWETRTPAKPGRP